MDEQVCTPHLRQYTIGLYFKRVALHPLDCGDKSCSCGWCWLCHESVSCTSCPPPNNTTSIAAVMEVKRQQRSQFAQGFLQCVERTSALSLPEIVPPTQAEGGCATSMKSTKDSVQAGASGGPSKTREGNGSHSRERRRGRTQRLRAWVLFTSSKSSKMLQQF